MTRINAIRSNARSIAAATAQQLFRDLGSISRGSISQLGKMAIPAHSSSPPC